MKRTLTLFLSAVLILGALMMGASAFPAWNGDANGDGAVNVKDAMTIAKYLADWDIELDPLADFDSNGKVNVKDAMMILKHMAGYYVAPDSLVEAEYGVTEISFEIVEPAPTNTVKGSEFGFDTAAADNAEAFRAAAAYLKEHPGTTLEIEKGVYKTSSGCSFNGITDCVVDGGGSTFLFSNRSYFGIGGGTERFMVKNFTVDWDYETTGYSPTSVVRVKSRTVTDDPNIAKIEYEFVTVDDAAYAVNLPWDSMIGLNPETLTVGTLGGPGTYFQVASWHKSFELTAPNIVTATIKADSGPSEGHYFLVRHYNYSAPVFSHSDANNVTYRDINIYSGPGGGIYANGQTAHHVLIDGVTIGLNPETADKYRMSTTADAINFKNTGGYLIIDNCDVGYQGDDCLNIHSTPGMVVDAYENELEMIVRNGNNFYVGADVSFKRSSNFTDVDFSAKIVEYTLQEKMEYGQVYIAVLDKEIPRDIVEGDIVWNTANNGENYIVRNSYFHENRARGLLLGSPNGLVENCRFYRHEQGAINIPIDYGSMWIEGTGVNNLIIRNCEFEECNLLGGGGYINLDNGTAFTESGLILGYTFKNILISDNTFINPKSIILKARGAENLSFIGNVIKNTDELVNKYNPDTQYLQRGQVELVGTVVKNATVAHNTWIPSPYNPEKPIVAGNSIIKNGFREFGNSISYEAE